MANVTGINGNFLVVQRAENSSAVVAFFPKESLIKRIPSNPHPKTKQAPR